MTQLVSQGKGLCLWSEQFTLTPTPSPAGNRCWELLPTPTGVHNRLPPPISLPYCPACSNLLPSTLNFIFLMKCHLLTSGRIIIKRNGHKAIFTQTVPPPAYHPLPAWRGRLHSRFMFSAAGTSQAGTQMQDGTELLSKPLAPVPCSFGG